MPPANEAFFDSEADAVAVDIYTQPADAVEAAPDRWRQRLKFLGPGVIISASIVGSGEIILTASSVRQLASACFGGYFYPAGANQSYKHHLQSTLYSAATPIFVPSIEYRANCLAPKVRSPGRFLSV